MRRFPPPWTVEKIAGGFKIVDANGQALAYVYSRENPNDVHMAKVLTEDEARRVASNIAKLPDLLRSRE
jgi:K+/H+ antiporter YhaU regulatory subunit KhtT